MTGQWPNETIDHIDCNPLNNAFSNLRPASLTQQMGNIRVCAKNPSGFKGVTMHGSGRWMAKIQKDRVQQYVGLFDTPEEAYARLQEVRVRLFGEFSRGA